MSLLRMSFMGAVMILVIAGIRMIALNRLPRRTFLILWEIVLLRLLIPFSVPSSFSIYSLFGQYEQMVETEDNTAITNVFPTTFAAQTTPAAMEPVTVAPVESTGQVSVSVWTVIWLGGIVFLEIFFGLSYLKSYGEFRIALPVRNGFIESWLKNHRLARHISIRQSEYISAPLTYGILRPVILMPKDIDWENEEQLQYILEHEYTHIIRWDAVTKLLFTIVLCIHWFNPLVWVMYLLVNRDIELSCDETVIRIFGEKTRSQYAMALIHMEERKSGIGSLYNHFSRNAAEERIRSIMKIKKKSVGAFFAATVIVAGIVILFAFSAQEKKETAEKADTVVNKNTIDNNNGEETELKGDDATGVPEESLEGQEELSNQDETVGEVRESTTTLDFVIEGETEAVPVTLYVGNGYSIYIPDEGWQTTAPDTWLSTVNEQVQLRVTCYSGKSGLQLTEELYAEGYSDLADDRASLIKVDEDSAVTTKAILGEFADDTWGIFYSYPSEAEEGWGSRLAVIADTFAWSAAIKPEDAETALKESKQGLEDLQTEVEDAAAVSLKLFVEAYFHGDTETLRTFLDDSYTGDIEVYEGSAEISDITIKGLDNLTGKVSGDMCTVSAEFKENSADDSFQYLTIELVKEEDGWKVAFYGLER